jgi:hypothetical protein
MERVVSDRPQQAAPLIRAAKHSIKGVVLSKREADLIGDKHATFEKIKLSLW